MRYFSSAVAAEQSSVRYCHVLAPRTAAHAALVVADDRLSDFLIIDLTSILS